MVRMTIGIVIALGLVACGGKINGGGECTGLCEDPTPPTSTTTPMPDPSPPGASTTTPGKPPPTPGKPLAPSEIVFKKVAFKYDRSHSACKGGDLWVQQVPPYGWVGLELCSATRYKIYLGESLDSMFHEIGDFAGHGQDHCELVNPKFRIPNEDDITSGGCNDCNVQMGPWEDPGPVPVYTRANFGEAFKLQKWPDHNLYTSVWYECGVSIGQ